MSGGRKFANRNSKHSKRGENDIDQNGNFVLSTGRNCVGTGTHWVQCDGWLKRKVLLGLTPQGIIQFARAGRLGTTEDRVKRIPGDQRKNDTQSAKNVVGHPNIVVPSGCMKYPKGSSS